MSARMFLILIVCFASIALADDFKTIDGKEYKNVTVSRVEPDGIVLTSKSGISKVYFTELPKEVQERFHYDAAKATGFSAEQTANQEALYKQRKELEQTRGEERKKYWSEHATPDPQRRSTNAVADAAVVSALAQTPTPERELENCYLEVKNVESGLEIQRNWETSWGSYDRDHFNRIILNIRVGTVGKTGGPVKVQWFFLGRRLSDPQQRIVYGRGEKSVAVPAKYFTECYAAAPVLKSHVLNLAARGERYVSGAQHDGWVVCIVDRQDRILADRASSEELQKLFHDSPQFARLPSK
jgi:hypothetical protein